jgi:hypothetical protein
MSRKKSQNSFKTGITIESVGTSFDVNLVNDAV